MQVGLEHRAQGRRGRDQVDGPSAGLRWSRSGRPRAGGWVVGGCVVRGLGGWVVGGWLVGELGGDQQSGATEAVRSEVADSPDRSAGRAHRHRIGQVTQNSGDGRLVTALHADQPGDRTQHSQVGPVQQLAGAVGPLERQGKRIATGRRGGAIALGCAVGQLQSGQPLSRRSQRELGPLVGEIQIDLTVVKAARLVVQAAKAFLRPRLPRPGSGLCLGESFGFLVRGLDPRTQPTQLSGQSCSALAPIRRCPHLRHESLLLTGEQTLGRGAARHRELERAAVGGQLVLQSLLLRPGGGGFSIELVGVAMWPRGSGRRRQQMAMTLGGQGRDRLQSLLQRAEGEPGVLRLRHRRRLVGRSLLELGLLGLGTTQLPARFVTLGCQGSCLGALRRGVGAQPGDVVGEQT